MLTKTEAYELFISGLTKPQQDRIAAVAGQMTADAEPGFFPAVIVTDVAVLGVVASEMYIKSVNEARPTFNGSQDGLRREAGRGLYRAIQIRCGAVKPASDEDTELFSEEALPLLIVAALKPEAWTAFTPGSSLLLMRIFINGNDTRILSAVVGYPKTAPRRRLTGRQTAKLPAKVRRAPRPRQR